MSGERRGTVAATCCSASRITIGSARASNSSARSWKTSRGLASRTTEKSSARASASAIYQEALRALDRSRAGLRLHVLAQGLRDQGSGIRDQGVGEIRYQNTCRGKGIPLSDDVGWRVIIEPGVERFVDEILGPQEQDPSEQCGDLLVRDRNGNWTYQYAVTVDDHLQQISDVIRGVDLLPSTGRQIRLARLLGRDTPPRFWHHALIMKSPTQKLSKSDHDTGIRDLRASGWTREQVLEKAANLQA